MIPRTRKIRKITRKTKNSTLAMLAAPAAISVKPSAAATREIRKNRRAQRSMSSPFLHRGEPVRLAARGADLDRMAVAHGNAGGVGGRREGCRLGGIRPRGSAIVCHAPAVLVGNDFIDRGTHCTLRFRRGARAAHP